MKRCIVALLLTVFTLAGHSVNAQDSLNANDTEVIDSSAAEVSVEDAMKTKISRNENEDMIPYILFYHYKH